MPKWRQDANTGRLIPIDESAQRASVGFIHGDIESFISPVDGTIISDRKQLREHNKRNGVVSADEFSPEFYARKAKERADFYEGKHSRAETLARKQSLYETILKLERKG